MSHLWAVGLDDVARADQVCAQLLDLEWSEAFLIEDLVVAARQPDGSLQLRHAIHPNAEAITRGSIVGFVVGLLLLRPLTGAGLGALAGGAVAALHDAGIDRPFLSEAEAALRPGTSAVFLLDRSEDMERVLPRLRGLGGKVLRTNVDEERLKQIQAALNAPPAAGAL
jgi:uncharacterized membrane protein